MGEPPDSSGWWQSFFPDLFVDLQLGGMRDETAAHDAEFVARALGLAPGATVLDVPVGTGRVALELARGGYRVTGVDFSAPVVEVARRKATLVGLELDLHVGDMRDLPHVAQFDAAICFWGSFGYFDDRGDRAFANSVFRSLRPGGAFLIDVPVAESLLPHFRERDWSWVQLGAQSIRVLEERRLDIETARIESTWTIVANGHEKTSRASIRLYTYRGLWELLRDCGFKNFTALETMTGKQFQVGSSRLSLVARK
jgi:SAM-dependent methyltransferase